MGIFGIIDELGGMEEALQEREFVSPVFNTRLVATQVDGLVYTFKIPQMRQGWYKFKPVDPQSARSVGEASFLEREQYLSALEKYRVVLVMKHKSVYLAVPEKMNKFRLSFKEPVPVLLPDDSVMDFEQVIVRYDGVNTWFGEPDPSYDPRKGDYLRRSLEELVEPLDLKFSGLTFEEKQAYSFRVSLSKRFIEDRKEKGLRESVEHAGGAFIRFLEREDHYSVTYRVEGEEYTSQVSKDPVHRVLSAGLCLNSNDRRFDLKSLVTVIREGQRGDLIYKTHGD